MFATWFKRRRRGQILAEPFPEEWESILRKNVWRFATLNPDEQHKARNDLRVFAAEKNWEGCGGLAMSDEIKVTISAQIAMLVLGFTEQYFDAVLSILVYPDAYLAEGRHVVEGGLVVEGGSAREGEAWYRGPVILSWKDVLRSGRGESRGRNLVCHEFAHQLDMLNGRVADGVPPLESVAQANGWAALVKQAFDELRHDCAHGRRSVFDCYGATNMAEFFAVATETFFEQPSQFKRHHGELYSMFQLYYRQDPLSYT